MWAFKTFFCQIIKFNYFKASRRVSKLLSGLSPILFYLTRALVCPNIRFQILLDLFWVSTLLSKTLNSGCGHGKRKTLLTNVFVHGACNKLLFSHCAILMFLFNLGKPKIIFVQSKVSKNFVRFVENGHIRIVPNFSENLSLRNTKNNLPHNIIDHLSADATENT